MKREYERLIWTCIAFLFISLFVGEKIHTKKLKGLLDQSIVAIQESNEVTKKCIDYFSNYVGFKND